MFFSLISIRHFEGAWETGSELCPIALWDYFDCFVDTRHVDWDGCIAGAPLHADVQSHLCTGSSVIQALTVQAPKYK